MFVIHCIMRMLFTSLSLSEVTMGLIRADKEKGDSGMLKLLLSQWHVSSAIVMTQVTTHFDIKSRDLYILTALGLLALHSVQTILTSGFKRTTRCAALHQ